MQAVTDASGQALFSVVVGRKVAEAGVLAGVDDVLDAGVDPVACVDVGALAAPAPGVLGQVRRPEAVAPAVAGLEQGELRAGVRPLAAGEDLHRLGPCLELVAVRPPAQEAGQLGDVGFFDPAGPAPAPLVRAGFLCPALADLAAGVDRGFPGGFRDEGEGGLLPLAERPAVRREP